MFVATSLDFVDGHLRSLGLLPLPEGERGGVRGVGSFDHSVTPSPDALRASTSPLRGEVRLRREPGLDRLALVRLKVR